MDLQAATILAIQRQQAGDLAAAEKLYGQVLMAHPTHAVSLHNLGTIRHQRGDTRAALELITAATQANPREALYHCSLGIVRDGAGDHLGAIASLREAIRLQPDHVPAWENLGAALERQQQFDEAIHAFQHALTLQADARRARGALYNLLRDAGRMQEAEALYDYPLSTNPLDADYVVKRGMARLRHGDHGGWRDYSWGHWSPEWLRADRPVLVPLPQWEGQPLPEDGLLLYGEQGIGDEIMFASLVPRVAARVARIVLLCEPRLVPLFSRSFPAVAVAAKPPAGQPPLLTVETGCKWRCSLSKLPAVLGITENDIPGTAYLRADPQAVQRWRQQLTALGASLTVGLSWRGGGNDRVRATRSVPLPTLAPLFELAGIRLINVQYGAHQEEIAASNATTVQPLISLDDIDPLSDMDGLAALLQALDCVVTVDNSTAHLAGALGVPTWMLCPFNADWRWMREREDSPWYHSLRLIRQPDATRDAWLAVVTRIAQELQEPSHLRSSSSATVAVCEARASVLTSPPVASTPTALLINDTTYWSDWGCSGTSLALHAGLRAAGHIVDSVPAAIVNQLAPLPANAADLDDDGLFDRFARRHADLLRRMQAASEILINGEDGIRQLDRTARTLLYLAWIARRRLGKRTSIINHSCLPCASPQTNAQVDAFYTRVYECMDFVAVRDGRSAAQLARLGIEAVQGFDCLPLFIDAHWRQSPALPERRIVLCGDMRPTPAIADLLEAVALHLLERGYAIDVLVGASAFPALGSTQLVAALHPRLRGRYTLIAATSECQWLRAIAGAQLLVCGGFHHGVAAACLGVPFAMIGHEPPQIDGLLERLGLSADTIGIAPEDAATAISRVTQLLHNPHAALVSTTRLAELRELSKRNFAGLRLQ